MRLALLAILCIGFIAPRVCDAAVVVADPKGGAAPAPQPEEVKPQPEIGRHPPPPSEKYSRREALLMTVLPTALLPTAGAVVLNLGFLASDFRGMQACFVSGSAVAGLGIVFGPSIGYFWLGSWRHALWMSGLRALTLTVGIGTMTYYVAGENREGHYCEDDSGEDYLCSNGGVNPVMLVLSIGSFTALALLTILDAALVGRAVDRANERHRKEVNATVAPMAWTDGNGTRSYGLALHGTF